MIAKAEAEGPVPIDDPFFEAKLSQEANSSERLEQAERDAALQPLDLENDLPEGLEVEGAVLDRLQELRLTKIGLQLDIEKAKHDLRRVHLKETDLEEEVHSISDKINELRDEKSDVHERVNFNKSNIEVIVKLKQGFDEVEQQAVVTDYSDSVLLGRRSSRIGMKKSGDGKR